MTFSSASDCLPTGSKSGFVSLEQRLIFSILEQVITVKNVCTGRRNQCFNTQMLTDFAVKLFKKNEFHPLHNPVLIAECERERLSPSWRPRLPDRSRSRLAPPARHLHATNTFTLNLSFSVLNKSKVSPLTRQSSH